MSLEQSKSPCNQSGDYPTKAVEFTHQAGESARETVLSWAEAMKPWEQEISFEEQMRVLWDHISGSTKTAEPQTAANSQLDCSKNDPLTAPKRPSGPAER